jgi:hypothetical protein
MFDSKTNLTARLTDAVDLLIDFATLGEYGLEPVEAPRRPCQARRRPHTSRPATRARVNDRARGVTAVRG